MAFVGNIGGTFSGYGRSLHFTGDFMRSHLHMLLSAMVDNYHAKEGNAEYDRAGSFGISMLMDKRGACYRTESAMAAAYRVGRL